MAPGVADDDAAVRGDYGRARVLQGLAEIAASPRILNCVLCVCVCIYIYIYIYIYKYIYIYTHRERERWIDIYIYIYREREV